MLTELYWIDGPWPGRLAIAPRPRGGEWLQDEMRGWHDSGIDDVVSLLTPDEEMDLDLIRERESCEANGIRFYSFPIIDRSIPQSDAEMARLAADLDSELSNGKNVAIHCRQGVGRSGLVAASLLLERGRSPIEAVRLLSRARRAPVPETAEQRSWIDSYASVVNQHR